MDSQCSRGRGYFDRYLSRGDVRKELLDYATECMGPKLKEHYQPEDVVQRAFFEAWKKGGCFQCGGPREFTSWLRRFINHQILRLARRVRQIQAEQQGVNGQPKPPKPKGALGFDTDGIHCLPDPRPGPAERIVARERAMLVHEMLQRLIPEQRSMVELVCIDEMSVKEAGESLGLKPSAASKKFQRGRERLKVVLEPLLKKHDP